MWFSSGRVTGRYAGSHRDCLGDLLGVDGISGAMGAISEPQGNSVILGVRLSSCRPVSP